MAIATPQKLLKSAYEQLGYSEGPLFEGASDPNNLSRKDWIEKGEWLTLTKEVGAEKIFFVENNPVAVFAQSEVNEPEALRKLFNKIWCMSRPRLLFLAVPGQLTVYDLAKEPAENESDWCKVEPLEIAESANEVSKKLKAFRREQLETGRLFEEYHFGDLKYRADKAIINDLKEVRRELIDEGLGKENIKYAHALIGRSIFIRYLEDREVLIPEDFYEIASANKKWGEILENKVPRSGIDLSETDSLYARVLSDKDFTFALFEKLTVDFNGDMFPNVKKEKQVITQKHLNLIQDLLFGDVGKQKQLFFYAYQFKIIPIELISSIYEEFYHPEVYKDRSRKSTKKSSEGAYYTPPALVEFLINQVLTPERLETKPRVLDPACGSGIFLVEAFRRIVRHRRLELGKKPNFQNLQKILREQIAGIEINQEAARIASFSLYLAMLHYLDPPSIREQIYKRGNRLPYLIYHEDENQVENKQQERYYNIILAKNAFDSDYIENNPLLKRTFAPSCADIVIGNPPWGSPGTRQEDKEARETNKLAVEWCDRKQLPVGDQERSQTFIWRTLDLLKPNGHASLLVSTGVFLKYGKNSVKFREKWLSENTLVDVYNFAHTRKVFFSGADSPFAVTIFSKKRPSNSLVSYWASRKTLIIEQLISAIFYKNDLNILPYNIDELKNYQTWKILWWGNQLDKRLISFIHKHQNIYELSGDKLTGQGYKKANQKYKSNWLTQYKEFPINHFTRYGKISFSNFKDPPSKVERRGVREIYEGNRILVKRGIQEKGSPKGQIIARFEGQPFCFTNAIHGIKLKQRPLWEYKIILGILWSTLARYYFFLTSSNWGIWHHEIQENELLQFPICFPKSVSLKKHIISIVDELRDYNPQVKDLNNPKGIPKAVIQEKRKQLEHELDQAIFELYELSDVEIDLIRDLCEVTLPYYYSPDKSMSSKPVLTKRLSEPFGTINSLPKNTYFSDYLKVFMHSWDAYLDKDTEFGWQVYQPEQTDSMIAVVFSIQEKGKKINDTSNDEIKCWDDVLSKLEESLEHPFHSSSIYLEGMVRSVTDDFILIIKRNERRLWTRSMAREDAEATLVQAMNRDNVKERIRK